MASTTHPISISLSSIPRRSSALPPELRAQLAAAFLAAGSVPKFQTAFSSSLDRTGWTANLQAYVMELLESGECKLDEHGYQDLLGRVMDSVREGRRKWKGREDEVEREESGGKLIVPSEVIAEIVKVVRVELEKVCVVVDSDEEE